MRVIDPGHSYLVKSYDSQGEEQQIDFVKRMGGKYPGNLTAHPGTIMQELLRVLIHRAKHLNQQESWSGNDCLIESWREDIRLLEDRAAFRHGRKLKRRGIFEIEKDPTCEQCGHIECGGSCRAD